MENTPIKSRMLAGLLYGFGRTGSWFLDSFGFLFHIIGCEAFRLLFPFMDVLRDLPSAPRKHVVLVSPRKCKQWSATTYPAGGRLDRDVWMGVTSQNKIFPEDFLF